jgi:hypothetical protein
MEPRGGGSGQSSCKSGLAAPGRAPDDAKGEGPCAKLRDQSFQVDNFSGKPSGPRLSCGRLAVIEPLYARMLAHSANLHSRKPRGSACKGTVSLTDLDRMVA